MILDVLFEKYMLYKVYIYIMFIWKI